MAKELGYLFFESSSFKNEEINHIFEKVLELKLKQVRIKLLVKKILNFFFRKKNLQ